MLEAARAASQLAMHRAACSALKPPRPRSSIYKHGRNKRVQNKQLFACLQLQHHRRCYRALAREAGADKRARRGAGDLQPQGRGFGQHHPVPVVKPRRMARSRGTNCGEGAAAHLARRRRRHASRLQALLQQQPQHPVELGSVAGGLWRPVLATLSATCARQRRQPSRQRSRGRSGCEKLRHHPRIQLQAMGPAVRAA